ncbi:hypothetical protein L9F63_011240, partial [Diploptera punctata]
MRRGQTPVNLVFDSERLSIREIVMNGFFSDCEIIVTEINVERRLVLIQQKNKIIIYRKIQFIIQISQQKDIFIATFFHSGSNKMQFTHTRFIVTVTRIKTNRTQITQNYKGRYRCFIRNELLVGMKKQEEQGNLWLSRSPRDSEFPDSITGRKIISRCSFCL